MRVPFSASASVAGTRDRSRIRGRNRDRNRIRVRVRVRSRSRQNAPRFAAPAAATDAVAFGCAADVSIAMKPTRESTGSPHHSSMGWVAGRQRPAYSSEYQTPHVANVPATVPVRCRGRCFSRLSPRDAALRRKTFHPRLDSQQSIFLADTFIIAIRHALTRAITPPLLPTRGRCWRMNECSFITCPPFPDRGSGGGFNQ